MTPSSGDRGAATVVTVGLLAVIVLAFTATATISVAVAARHQAQSAADLAALAGADVALGVATGVPCERATQVAAANGGSVLSCSQDGTIIRIKIAVHSAVGTADAAARAGPPVPRSGGAAR